MHFVMNVITFHVEIKVNAFMLKGPWWCLYTWYICQWSASSLVRQFILVCIPLQWRHNERDGVSNHRRRVCLLNCLSRCRSKNTSKLCVTGLCEGNPPVTGWFPSQRVSNADFFSIWRRGHATPRQYQNHCWLIVNWTFQNNLQWNFSKNTKLSFTKIHE